MAHLEPRQMNHNPFTFWKPFRFSRNVPHSSFTCGVPSEISTAMLARKNSKKSSLLIGSFSLKNASSPFSVLDKYFSSFKGQSCLDHVRDFIIHELRKNALPDPTLGACFVISLFYGLFEKQIAAKSFPDFLELFLPQLCHLLVSQNPEDVASLECYLMVSKGSPRLSCL